jgi:hypothetical protein
MGTRHSDPLGRTRREMRRERLDRQRDNMTAAEIGGLMRKVVHEALDKNGCVQERDFIAANLPLQAIRDRARAILNEVLHERANGGIMA